MRPSYMGKLPPPLQLQYQIGGGGRPGPWLRGPKAKMRGGVCMHPPCMCEVPSPQLQMGASWCFLWVQGSGSYIELGVCLGCASL